MSRKILINGLRAEEMRVAIVDNRVLEDFEIETKSSGLSRNNIYRATVSNVAPSLNAAFVDFGEEKNGFLAFNDVVESVYHKPVRDYASAKISDVLVAGQQIIVQVIKDAAGNKGAQLTTNVSIAGRYLVLRPKDAKSGVSRKVDEDARVDLVAKAKSLDLPEGVGCIVRTNALDQSRAVLLREAKALLQLWKKIEVEASRGNGPKQLYNDHDIVVQVLRDYFDASVSEVLIDCEECYERALAYVHATMPSNEDKLKRYTDRVPLFSKFDIERQIDQIFDRRVNLPSGGFIVIDPTEALTAIDVNSAKSTKRDSQDMTAYHTNLEASTEIARQLRLRDIGGLIVVDFIDMRIGKHQRDVERAVRNAMARDKARNKSERISANGLMEINRQRISQALSVRTHFTCPTCEGRGFIPNIEMFGLNLIRAIEAQALEGKIGGALIKLHPDIAESVQNLRRHEIVALEKEFNIRIEIVADREVSRSDESIEWLAKSTEIKREQKVATMSVADTAPALESEDDFPRLKRSFNQDDEDLKTMDYRPNDYEVFASDEARERRHQKRNNKKHDLDEENTTTQELQANEADDAPSQGSDERRTRNHRRRTTQRTAPKNDGQSLNDSDISQQNNEKIERNHRDNARSENSRNESSRNESSRNESSRNESSRNESSRNENSRNENSRNENARQRKTNRPPIEAKSQNNATQSETKPQDDSSQNDLPNTRLPFSSNEIMQRAQNQRSNSSDTEQNKDNAAGQKNRRDRQQRNTKPSANAPTESQAPQSLAQQEPAKQNSRRQRSSRNRSQQLQQERSTVASIDAEQMHVVQTEVPILPMNIVGPEDSAQNTRPRRERNRSVNPNAVTPEASPVVRTEAEESQTQNGKAQNNTRQRRTQRTRPSLTTQAVTAPQEQAPSAPAATNDAPKEQNKRPRRNDKPKNERSQNVAPSQNPTPSNDETPHSESSPRASRRTNRTRPSES